MGSEDHIVLPTITQPFSWLNGTGSVTVDEGSFVMEAPAVTDWFIDPVTGAVTRTAAALVTPAPPGPFTLQARVHAETYASFDAGALFVHGDDETWAKLCLERSPAVELMVVSVVTRGTSDDCNSKIVGDTAWLRVARVGDAFAFHCSADGSTWELIRVFRLQTGEARIGFVAQSPVGEGAAATFDQASIAETRL